MIVKTEAIVLNSMKYGDSSKINKLYTLEHGMQTTLAKGARAMNSRFGSALEPVSHIQAAYYKKPSRSMYVLSGAEHSVPLRKIGTSIEHLSAAMLIIETIAATQQENDPNAELFTLSADSLLYLNTLPANPFSVFVRFQLNFAKLQGFGMVFPDVDDDGIRYFSIESGTFTQIAAANGGGLVIKLKSETAALLKLLNEGDLESTAGKGFSKEARDGMIRLFEGYFGYHFDKKISFKTYMLLNY
ncbi:MAG: DNA repair protein RecO [Bacteroidota bacterium]